MEVSKFGSRFMTAWLGSRPKVWDFESLILLFVGVTLLLTHKQAENFGIVLSTIVLVVGLGGMLGITRIPFPTKIFGKELAMWALPIVAFISSCFMDSYLVLLMAVGLVIAGCTHAQRYFNLYIMSAALTGGLGLYFGEVYELALALQYGVTQWYGMLPVLPPVIIFTAVLSYLTYRLSKRGAKITGMREPDHGTGDFHNYKANVGDYVEAACMVAALLYFHNPLIFVGTLCTYAAITGQGKDLIEVFKSETEMGVLMLLIIAAALVEPAGGFIAEHFSGWWGLLPSAFNAVLSGAVFPASGDFWFDTMILSAFVMITPFTSLVGVMVFKTTADWKFYLPRAFGLTLIWIALLAGWFLGVWPHIEDPYYEWTGFDRPTLERVVDPPSIAASPQDQ